MSRSESPKNIHRRTIPLIPIVVITLSAWIGAGIAAAQEDEYETIDSSAEQY